jgi:hypothetical protein
MADSKLRVNLIGDASSLNRALSVASAKLNVFSKRAETVGASLSTRISLPLAIAAGAAIKFGSDLVESLNKVDVAFGDSSDRVKEFANTSLRSFGIARGQALEMTALFGDMATGMGISQEKAADLSIQLASLAGDLSSFKNINIEEVTTALAGVFTGETESLKRLGIVMTEVNLKYYAMAQGITKTLKEMSQQEKIMLRMQYIMRVTENAQGDFARTSDSLANQLRIAKGSIQELAEELGLIMLPAAKKVVKQINELVTEFRNLDRNTKQMIITIGALAAAVPPVIYTFGKLLNRTNRIIVAIAAIGYVAYKNFDTLIDGATKAANQLIKLYNEFYGIQILVDATRILFKILGITISAAFQEPGEFMRRFAEQISALYNQTLSYLGVLNKFLFDVRGLDDAFAEAEAAIDRTMKAFTEGSIFNSDSVREQVDELETEMVNLMRKIANGEMSKIEFVTKEQLIKPFEDFEAYVTDLMNRLSNTLFGEGAAKGDSKKRELLPIGDLSTALDGLGNVATASLNMIGNSVDSLNQKIINARQFVENYGQSIAQGLSNAFYQAMNSGESFVQSMIKQLDNLVKRLLAAAAVAALLFVLFPGGGSFAQYFSMASGINVGGGGGSGGFKFKPIDPNLGKNFMPTSLSGGNNINLTGQFRLDGQDLVVAVERANKARNGFI